MVFDITSTLIIPKCTDILPSLIRWHRIPMVFFKKQQISSWMIAHYLELRQNRALSVLQKTNSICLQGYEIASISVARNLCLQVDNKLSCSHSLRLLWRSAIFNCRAFDVFSNSWHLMQQSFSFTLWLCHALITATP